MKILKRLLKIGIVIILILCVFIGVLCLPFCSSAISSCFQYGCVSKEESARNYIKKVTEIEIPKNAKLLYNYTPKNPDVLPVPGRSEDYFVFEFESQPTEWLTENEFSSKKNTVYENNFLNGGFGLNEISMKDYIPQKYLPDFNNKYFWYEKDHIYFVYFSDSKMLIIFVSPN